MAAIAYFGDKFLSDPTTVTDVKGLVGPAGSKYEGQSPLGLKLQALGMTDLVNAYGSGANVNAASALANAGGNNVYGLLGSQFAPRTDPNAPLTSQDLYYLTGPGTAAGPPP
jgi:hypothetical protein